VKVSIQAGAGTGKTTEVIRRLLRHLLATDGEPWRVLALTFTVRAANEMRDRLGTWLARLVAGAEVPELGGGIGIFDRPDRARARGERALAHLDRMEIGTIHAFAAHLLRQYPLEAGVGPSFVEDDGTAEAALFRELWPAWLSATLADTAEVERLAVLLTRVGDGAVERFARALCHAEPRRDGEVTVADGASWRARFEAAVAELDALRASCPAPRRANERQAAEALVALGAVFGAARMTPELEQRARVLDDIGWPQGKDWRAGAAIFQRLRALARHARDCDETLLMEIAAWLGPFVERFRREFARRGYVSFDGLLGRTAALLRGNPDIRAHCKRRIQLVMVDEFQDTDPLQAEILLYMTERGDRCAPTWRDVEVEPGKLVIVGDEKQSIYLFRGADLAAYQATAHRLTGGHAGAVEHLTVNYRSRRELVSFVNAIARHVMSVPTYVPIVPAPTAGEGGRIEMMVFPELGAAAARRAEAMAIAGWIEEERERGRLAWRDVALLLRSLGDVEEYAAALRARGIDFLVDGEKRLYGTQEVIDLVNLLAAVADPTDARAVVGLLRSPVGGVRDRDLLALRNAGALSAAAPERVPAALGHVSTLYERLRHLNARSRRIPVAVLVREIVATFPILELAWAGPRGEQALANVRKVVDTVAHAGAVSFAGAVEEYRRRVREGEEEGEAALADDEWDAVRVMTVHKAKGLEFPVVILADLHREPVGHEPRPILSDWLSGRIGRRCGRVCDREWVLAEERYRTTADEEERRVLYVALTRARDTLLLTGGDPQSGTLQLLVSALASEGMALGGPGRRRLDGAGFVVDVSVGETATGPMPTVVASTPAAEMTYQSERRRWEERAEECARWARRPTVARPSALVAAQDADFGVDTDTHEPVEAGEATMTPSLSLGVQCHRALATLDLARPDIGALATDVRNVLEPFLRSAVFRELRGAERIVRELPFIVCIEGQTWSGQIDVLYRSAGMWVVADYKTDRHEAPGRYRGPARIYAAAAQRFLRLAEPPPFRLIYLRSGRMVSP
jgi:ATP-dependent helicase/nuclease subunit A